MARRSLSRAVAAALTVVFGLVGSHGCGSGASVFGTCSDRDRQLATVLGRLAVIDAHPDGAVSITRYADCDNDDGFAYAGQQFRTSLNRSQILAFYRTAANNDAWHFDGDNPPPPTDGLAVTAAATCYTKQIDGTTAYLKIPVISPSRTRWRVRRTRHPPAFTGST